MKRICNRWGYGIVATLASCDPRVDTVAEIVIVRNTSSGSGGVQSPGTGGGGSGGASTPDRGDQGAVSSGGTDTGPMSSGGTDPGPVSSGGAPPTSAGGPGVEEGCTDGFPRIGFSSADAVERSRCTASFARHRMSYALCSCEDFESLGRVSTVSFDSARDAPVSGSAAVGVNGQFKSQLSPLIDGSFIVAGSTTLLLPALDVSGDLRLKGSLRTSGPLLVGRDAWFAESSISLTTARIGRDVHLAPGKSLDGLLIENVGGQVIRESFAVSPPCPCDAPEALEWTSAIATASTRNDDATLGLDVAALESPSANVDLALPCGRFYLTRITGDHDVRLRVTGRAALFVAGDVVPTGRLDVELAPEAELDWFVGGEFQPAGSGMLGDQRRPGGLRIYVAGSESISLSRERAAGNFYAPRADVSLVGIGGFYGSVFARSLHTLADLVVHYDVSAQNAGDTCADDEPATCAGCAECTAGTACIEGICAACSADADCCLPLVCAAGRCLPLAQ